MKSDVVSVAGEGGASEITAATYAHFAPYVRGRLAELGVREADLPDLCHEVFLIVHDKVDRVPAVERLDLWLRAICRRVAAGYRRRSGHRLEILQRDLQQESQAGDPDLPIGAEAELREQLERVRKALNRLDDESRDLLALHDVGQMPITDLARLVEHDRKTVRKRLVSARRRVSRLVCQDTALDGPAARMTPPESPLLQVQAAKGRARGCTSDELDILQLSDHRSVGLIGNVTMATWDGCVTPQVFEHTLRNAPYILAHGGGEIVYLALIEPTLEPPSLPVRQQIVEALEIVGPYVTAFAVAMLGGQSSISAAIIRGMMLLVKPRFPIRDFPGIEPAAAWLCDTYAHGARGPLSPAALTAAAERLRSLRGDRARS